eukprot:g35811.t1
MDRSPSYACLFVGYVELLQYLFITYTGTVPQLFHRYFDDCIGAATYIQAELEQFIDFADNFQPALKFTCQLIRVKDPYVLVKMKNKDGKIQEAWMTREVEIPVKNKKEVYKVTKMIDESRAVNVIYLDISKAFGKVLHGKLIQKVKSIGTH